MRTFRLLAVLVFIAYWVVVVLAMHIVEPEFDPLRAPLSAYVLGAYGSWMTTTYFAAGAAVITLGYEVWSALPRTIRSTTAFACYVFTALSVIVQGIFPIDYPPPPHSLAGVVHAIAGISYLPLLPTAVLLFSLALREYRHWQGAMAFVVVVLALCMLVMSALVPLGIAYPGLFGLPGLTQRLSISLHTVWVVMVVALMLRARDAGQPVAT